MMANRPGSYFHLHLLSDATGETLTTVARAAAAQYLTVSPIEHVYPLVRSHKQLDRVLTEIESSPVVRAKYALLAAAAGRVASPQIRNAGTLGGNLCQDTRCWYYRY